MPDALSKTVPIWCEVMNSLLLGENYGSTGIYTPEDVVSPSEHSQIQARLDSFVEEAKVPCAPFFSSTIPPNRGDD